MKLINNKEYDIREIEDAFVVIVEPILSSNKDAVSGVI